MARRWLPKQAQITAAAREHAHGRAIAQRCADLGIDVVELDGNRLRGLRGDDDRATYRRAKQTLAIVDAPPSQLKLQPIPPSADWQFHLARGCPAHCQYCYLAGSLRPPGRTRARFSVNADHVARRFEGGTAPVRDRLAALRTLAQAGYPVGLTVAPIMPFDGWEEGYARLADDVALAVDGLDGLDLTAELITHRFTQTSKAVLNGWYPASVLEMDEELRAQKRTKFGGTKWTYRRPVLKDLEREVGDLLRAAVPGLRVLYFT